MPEVLFHIRWPDGSRETCYSPSTVIKDFFVVGEPYPLAEFLRRSRDGLTAASERVRVRYGISCSRAMAQLVTIESRARALDPDGSSVVIEAFNG